MLGFWVDQFLVCFGKWAFHKSKQSALYNGSSKGLGENLMNQKFEYSVEEQLGYIDDEFKQRINKVAKDGWERLKGLLP